MGNQQQNLFEGRKTCKKCGKEKSIKDFGIYNSRGTTYRKNTCYECLRRWHKDYHDKDVEASRKRRREQARKYRANNREFVNSRSRYFSALYRDRDRDLIYEAYGNKCACCGEANPKFFTIDHVNNDGHIERKNKVYTSGSMFYRKIVRENFPANYQILCYNCNLGRARNGGICPHQECPETIAKASTPKWVEAPTASKKRL